MQEELEEKEEKFSGILNHDETQKTQKSKKLQGRKRPITSTKPGKTQNKKIIDYAEDNKIESEQDSFQTYDNYHKKEYKFNQDLDLSHQNQEDLNNVIDIMNNKSENETTQKPHIKESQFQMDSSNNTHAKIEEAPEEKEHDYLDFQVNLDNLKKIHEEQEKFDFMSNDLDS